MIFTSILPISLEQGLAYALVALGIALTFRVLSFPDLTVDGSFPLGGAVAARLIVEGVNPLVAALVALMAGFIAGCLTGILNTRLKINSLLAGILMMTILYSVNLRIMARANIQLLDRPTIFSPMEAMQVSRYLPVIIFFFLVTMVCKLVTDLFLHTEYGLALRATGDNEQMIRSLGVNTDNATIFGLGLSNALVALSGALVAQDQGFSDVGMGIGMIVAGLASIIIGETVIKPTTVFRLTTAAIVGSVIYRLIISLGLRLGLAPTDLKLATGVMVILALGIPALRGPKEGKLKLRGV
ncbi:MAG: ABC transporter permease [Deltaproteobacteria bacterium]|nr:ABC transporter permease [Deltaproteobacteria bacterium]MBW2072732.1 ABC transporter permease [Deltaproteobacteria bacterium]